MSVGVRDRVRRLRGCDRLLFGLIAFWIIAGIPGNYFRVRGLSNQGVLFWTFVAIILWAGISGVIAYSVIRRQRRSANYGISFQRGAVVSLAIIALFHIYLVASGKFVLSPGANLVWSAWGVFMEELVFRAIAIDQFLSLMDGSQHKAFGAIVASALLWSAMHIPSKSPVQVVGGIFLGGLLFGYIFHKTRSILLPAWIHSVANAGYAGGLLIVAVYCAIGVVDCAIGFRKKPFSRVPSVTAQ
jgi:membrane protease YdiL (CAAX protease family)